MITLAQAMVAGAMCGMPLANGQTGWFPAVNGTCIPQPPTLTCGPKEMPSTDGQTCVSLPKVDPHP